jgi:hypothetical protein
MNAKPDSDEYRSFEHLLTKVLSVSKAELNARLSKRKKEAPKSASPAPVVPTKPS